MSRARLTAWVWPDTIFQNILKIIVEAQDLVDREGKVSDGRSSVKGRRFPQNRPFSWPMLLQSLRT